MCLIAPDRMTLRGGVRGLDRTLQSCSQLPLRQRRRFGRCGGSSLSVTQKAVKACFAPCLDSSCFQLLSIHLNETNRHPTRSQSITTAEHVRSGSSMRAAEVKLCFVSGPVASAARGRGTGRGARCCRGRAPSELSFGSTIPNYGSNPI